MWCECTDNDKVYADLKTKMSVALEGIPFQMLLNATDYVAFATAWNQGIDAHLEALTERSAVGRMAGKAHIRIHPEELPTLVRRLFEGDESSEALAVDILGNLGMKVD